MPSITTRGIVLRYANYRDHDRMLTLLTPDYGRMDVLSRGCRRPKSALMPASECFVSGEFVVFQQNDRCTLTGCTLDDTFYNLRLDPYRLTCASYMAALCAAAAQPGQMMPVVLGQHPLGQLLKKAAVCDLDALGLAVVATADEDVALGEVAAGKENSRHRVGGAVLDGKLGHRLRREAGNAEGRAVFALLLGDEGAGLEPFPHRGDGGFLAHKWPIPPQNMVTARVA